ncbi:hypothetical protein CABS01_09266 [Colletotrichum abscissum]|uniref:Uncharacterized protein n=7 Tax=Colletotrichum acutatum species complex TaxID=2707335 RepID=A0A9P9X207_9PEZI|nr:uncharacterized protein CLUP02_13645 [Colletotrichum lupini]XP_060400350.1 uncharacterized protein CABS01_09266 [Colletotrichum abscissum]KAI3532177.1 hypothetical protein CABS02_13927 [Colletotrichum abscissum]KAK1502655.1 hypothetical protein CABS01_09266 [Colletotrichum abscissum]KAK1706025.1 hypothetical protein BDP67DRAFT_184463 [Colletotrichum lupini]UQC88123.1 hypothetical protein CLUP02_13645 [Colletotrichum lupini]
MPRTSPPAFPVRPKKRNRRHSIRLLFFCPLFAVCVSAQSPHFYLFFDLGHPFWPQSSSASSKYPYEVLTEMKERRTNNTTEYFFL